MYSFQFKKDLTDVTKVNFMTFRIWPFRVHASGFKVCRIKLLKYVRDVRGLAETTQNKDNTTAILKVFTYCASLVIFKNYSTGKRLFLKRFVINKESSIVNIQVVNGEYVFPNLKSY